MDKAFWKKYQFVTEVQTALMAEAMGTCGDTGEKAAILGSVMKALHEMNAVFLAAEKIPEDQSAHDAAVSYVNALMTTDLEDELDLSQIHLTS